jgi:hypothetical protein
MSNSKGASSHGNRTWESFRDMKEYKSIEVMNIPEMLIRQQSKA